jgi:hypothetical protein
MLHPILALLLASAPDAALQAEVDRALFDLCPRLIAGSLSLEDPSQLAGIGYEPGPMRGTVQHYRRAAGNDFVELSYGAQRKVCWVAFGGPDVHELFDGAILAARRAGFEGGPASAFAGISRSVALHRRRENERLRFDQLTVITEDDQVVGFAFLTQPEDQ